MNAVTSESLEKKIKGIMDYLGEDIDVFVVKDASELGTAGLRVEFDVELGYKRFCDIAKKQSRMMLFEKFYEEGNDKRIGKFVFSFFLDLVYCYSESTTNYNRQMQKGIGNKPKIPGSLEEKNPEELADEFVKNLYGEYGSPGSNEIYSFKNTFWIEKDVDRDMRFNSPPIAKIVSKTESLIEKKILEKENERIPELVKICVQWAIDNKKNKIFKVNIAGILDEKDVNLSNKSINTLYNKANLELAKGQTCH